MANKAPARQSDEKHERKKKSSPEEKMKDNQPKAYCQSLIKIIY